VRVTHCLLPQAIQLSVVHAIELGFGRIDIIKLDIYKMLEGGPGELARQTYFSIGLPDHLDHLQFAS
jgi:hypothetical protein